MTKDGTLVGGLNAVNRHSDDIALRLARLCEKINPWPLAPQKTLT